MKKFLAIIVVAILATSFAFSQTNVGTGTVTVTVNYPAIVVTDWNQTSVQTENMQPGDFKSPYKFEFQAVGAFGIPQTNVVGVWSTPISGAGATGVYATDHTNGSIDPALVYATYNDIPGGGQTTRWQVDFGLKCLPGTTIAGGPYTVSYTLTVNY